VSLSKYQNQPTFEPDSSCGAPRIKEQSIEASTVNMHQTREVYSKYDEMEQNSISEQSLPEI